MATISRGLSQIVFNGETVDLKTVPWLAAVRAIYRINNARTAWESFKPNRTFQAFSTLEANRFYFIYAVNTFTLADAQTLPCGTSENNLIPQGRSQFLYGGEETAINLTGVDLYKVNPTGTGWLSWKPNRSFNGFSSFVPGFYYAVAVNAFVLEGAQTTGCPDTYGSENIDGSKYVRYPDLLGEIPETAAPKTAPNMPLFKAKIEALEAPGRYDGRYYIKSETYNQAQVNALFQGVDEVIPLPTFDDFPQPGLPSKLYIDEQFNVGYRWSLATGYVAVSSPNVDLTPYLTKSEAANTYQVKGDYLTLAQGNSLYAALGSSWKKAESDNRYQFKGDYQPVGRYVKSITLQSFTYFPDGTGKITLFNTYDLLNALRTVVPGYKAAVAQTLNHAANGPIKWGEGAVIPQVTGNRYVKTGYVNSNYVK